MCSYQLGNVIYPLACNNATLHYKKIKKPIFFLILTDYSLDYKTKPCHPILLHRSPVDRTFIAQYCLDNEGSEFGVRYIFLFNDCIMMTICNENHSTSHNVKDQTKSSNSNIAYGTGHRDSKGHGNFKGNSSTSINCSEINDKKPHFTGKHKFKWMVFFDAVTITASGIDKRELKAAAKDDRDDNNEIVSNHSDGFLSKPQTSIKGPRCI